MCGILGMAFQQGHSMKDSEEVREIWKKLLVTSSSRGTDATGCAFVSLHNIMVIKHHIPATKFVETNYYKEIAKRRLVMDNIGNDPFIVIGHTRFKTKGSQANMHNNHPIVANKVVGVHNGVIGNDDALFDLYESDGVERKALVDSEIIFRLIDHHSKNQAPVAESIRKASSVLMGGYACAAVHVETPWVLWLFRHGGPIEIFRFPKRGLIIFASERHFIEKATEGLDLGNKAVIPIENDQAVAFNVKQNRQIRFTLEENAKYKEADIWD